MKAVFLVLVLLLVFDSCFTKKGGGGKCKGKKKALCDQINTCTTENANLESKNSELEEDIVKQNNQIDQLKDQTVDLKSKNSELEEDIVRQNNQIDELKDQTVDLNNKVTELKQCCDAPPVGNIALNKPSSQSSDYHPKTPAELAVDGNSDTTFWRSCACTKNDMAPWWMVDLRKALLVKTVYIVNRGDCCGERLSGFEIRVGDNPADGGSANALCGSGLSVPQGQGKYFYCEGSPKGRYVSVLIPGKKQYLTLCEVEVYSTVVRNIALNRPSSQSSDYHPKTPARLAVDGNSNTKFWKSCACTKNDMAPWWMVDLGTPSLVKKVHIVNRGDCCGERLSGFEIRVGDNPVGGGSANALCGSGLSVLQGQGKHFYCEGSPKGRYVSVLIPGKKQYLTLCEVEVFSTE